MGKLTGDVVCNAIITGCVSTPPASACGCRAGHDPGNARVKAYPVVERYHWVWIWMGDPAMADPAKIVDYHWLDDPEWGAKPDYCTPVQLAARHGQPARPHASGLRARDHHRQHGAGRACRGRVQAHAGRRAGDALDHRPAGAAGFVKIGGFTGNVDRWQIIDFLPPASSGSTSARRRPAPARPRVTASAASRCAT